MLKTGIKIDTLILNQFLCGEKDIIQISSLLVFDETFLRTYRIQKVSSINDKQTLQYDRMYQPISL